MPFAVRAQQASKVYRLGVLSPSNASVVSIRAVTLPQLAKAGFVEGHNLFVDTRMADAGALPHVIEAVLNHISGHRAGVAGIYNRAAYAAEKRAALDMLASHVAVAVAKADGGNVTRLKRKGK